LRTPKPTRPRQRPFNLKEFNMNEKSQSKQKFDLEVVDLGDAKELTMGIPAQVHFEDNPTILAKKQL
jgi:hypothetical protein